MISKYSVIIVTPFGCIRISAKLYVTPKSQRIRVLKDFDIIKFKIRHSLYIPRTFFTFWTLFFLLVLGRTFHWRKFDLFLKIKPFKNGWKNKNNPPNCYFVFRNN